MKKLNKKGKVHPSPASLPRISDQYLTLLPATIVALAATLSPEDKEVLAYLLSCCGCTGTKADSFSGFNETTHKSSSRVGAAGGDGGGDHAPVFECNCFRCYTSFWARWDTSPNRQLIHEIIEAYEEGLIQKKRNLKKKKRGNSGKRVCDEFQDGNKVELGESGSSVEVSCAGGTATAATTDLEVVGGPGGDDGDKAESEKGSVRKIVSFLGETIFGFLA